VELLEMNFLNITRAEAIQFLSASPIGTFLIRPHDSNPELYYLSFHSGESEAVKHAIIRKEIITTTVPSSPSTPAGESIGQEASNTNSNSTSVNTSMKSVAAASVKQRLDKSVSMQADEEERQETECGVGLGLGLDSASTDGSPRESADNNHVSKVVFKCGKVGPCDTIRDLIS